MPSPAEFISNLIGANPSHHQMQEFLARWQNRTDTEREQSVEQDDGFIPVLIETGDWALIDKTCPHCHQNFAAHDVVLQSYDRAVQLHAHCVEIMFHRLPGNVAVIAAEFERRRQEILDEPFLDG